MAERWKREYREPENKVYMTEGEIEAFVSRLKRGPICATVAVSETTANGSCCLDQSGTVTVEHCS